jgi:hypothetical protein
MHCEFDTYQNLELRKELNLIFRTVMYKNITSIIMKTIYNLRVRKRIIHRGGYAPVHCGPAIGVLDVSSEVY